jgi:CPA1 family monovalent cation:H+ antiporter
VENTVSLLTPLAAYLPAEWLHVSGVLSVVACGIYLGRLDPRVVSAQTRLQGIVLWRMVTFLLNGLLFLLVGMQLRHFEQELPAQTSLGALMLATLLVSLTVVAVRIAWVFPAAYLSHRLSSSARRDDPFPSWRHTAIVAWSGMRGGISLAVAIAIPLAVGEGTSSAPFPARDAVLFVTFGVILVTLVAQGLSLPPLIRALGIVAGQEDREEELRARYHTAHAAIERLDTLSDTKGIPPHIHEEVRRAYLVRHRRLNSRLAANQPGVAQTETADPGDKGEEPDAPDEADVTAYLRLKREVLDAERATALRLRDRGEISDQTLRRLQTDMDLEETRTGALDARHL